jgi:DNA-binding CsgD family transcriptional regulator
MEWARLGIRFEVSCASRSRQMGVDGAVLMLIERDEPMKALRAAEQQAAAGHGSVVVIGGEAGIGKTSLLRAFADGAAKSHRVLWGGCEALFTPRPLGPLHDIAPALDAKLAGLLDDGAPPAKIFRALLAVLQEMQGTAIVIFEDVHWADHATLDLIKYLGRRMMLLGALLIISLRSDEMEPQHPLAQVLGDLPAGSTIRIDLKPLSKTGVAALAAASGQTAEELYRVTRGNPFFVTQLLQRDDPTRGALPASLRDAVWAKLARLKPEERALAEAMSIVPGGIEGWLLRRLIDHDPEGLALPSLVERGDQSHYVFRHELARLATLERLSPERQRALHGRVLAAMLDKADQPLSRLVHHAAGAGDAAKVLELAPKAAAEAARLGAHQQAAAHWASALRFADRAAPELAAELYESWAYEAGLSLKIDEALIDALHKAVALWRQAGRTDRVGHDLRWLSRFHWYRGEAKQANDYLDQAISALETANSGPELAKAYAARAQMHMLNDRAAEAVEWGERAIALAESHGDIETRVHALNTVGTALLNSGGDGHAHLEESLRLALEHGFDEQAARAYTNYGEWAVLFRDFPLAERLLAEGIAFDTRHDLDAWTYYLTGRLAQLRMDQGRLREAETIAKGVLALERQTLLMKLPALMVLAKVHMRLGEADAKALLQQALKDALATGEQQYIAPARLALAEAAWLSGDLEACRQELRQVAALDVKGFDPWERGEFAVWWKRAAFRETYPAADAPIAAPRRAEVAGDHAGAAETWAKLGLPYEAGMTLLQQQTGEALARAASLFQSIDAKAAERVARRLARETGTGKLLPKRRRGPYSASRAHPLGLTSREVEILACLAEGMSNHEIAHKLLRSQRTIEHHVSAVLGKLNAASRLDVVLRLRSEPWLLTRVN